MTALIRRPAVSATALLLALAAGPAWAEVTAQQVWDDWKAQMSVYGENGVTVGSETYENGVLTVTDLGFNVAGEDGSTATGTLGELVLTENGDGTVSVTMSEEYPIRIVTPADPETGSEASEADLTFRQTGLTLTASGEPGALTYDVTAGRYAVELDSVAEGGVEQPAEALIAFNDVSGSFTSRVGEMRDVTYDLTATSMDLLLDVTNPDDGSSAMISGKVEDVTTRAVMSLPVDPAADPEMALQNGMTIDGGYTTQGGSYIFEINDPESGASNGTLITAGSSLELALSKDEMAYTSNATGVSLQVTAAAMPLPVTVSFEEVGANLQVPISKTAAPAPWAMALNLSGLAVDEQIWAMFDPEGMLSHEPATVKLDLSGTATLLFDVLDPAQAEAMAAAPMPAQVESVNINELEVSFGGASVSGSGALTLDNTDVTTMGGMPKPTGAIDLQLSGVNALIDGLVGLGVVPQDQAMYPRMMLGAFTTSTGADQATSRIEFTEDGQIIANGQRLQ
jgi:hypothetical protein